MEYISNNMELEYSSSKLDVTPAFFDTIGI
jgi:hypothetical protein